MVIGGGWNVWNHCTPLRPLLHIQYQNDLSTVQKMEKINKWEKLPYMIMRHLSNDIVKSTIKKHQLTFNNSKICVHLFSVYKIDYKVHSFSTWNKKALDHRIRNNGVFIFIVLLLWWQTDFCIWLSYILNNYNMERIFKNSLYMNLLATV